MHELALADRVVQICQRKAAEAGARRVLVIRLQIGALGHVDPDALEFAFASVSRFTPTEGARLDIERLPGRAWCADCAGEVELSGFGAPCPVCGGSMLHVVGGEEMRVREIEVS